MPDMAFTFTLWIIEFEEKYTCITSFLPFWNYSKRVNAAAWTVSIYKKCKSEGYMTGDVINYRNDRQDDRQFLTTVIVRATQTEVHNSRCADI